MTLMNHEAGRQCLLEVADVLDLLKVPFVLLQGTALGAYRDKGFPPTEKDIDLGILQEHFPGDQILSALGVRGFDVEAFQMPFRHVRTIVGWKQYLVNGTPHTVKVDLVGLARWKEWRYTATPVRPWIGRPYAIVHEARMLEPPYGEVKLFDRWWKLPQPIEDYLSLEYGVFWQVPTDDHVSRTRVYDFLEKEQVPLD